MKHLIPKHQFQHIMDVSIDRESEVKYLADKVGITEIYAEKSPEEKRDFSPNATTPTMRNFLIDRIFVLVLVLSRRRYSYSKIATDRVRVRVRVRVPFH